MRSVRQFFSALALAAAAAVFAADEPGRSPAGQGIEGAKHEYDAIKAADTPEAQQKLSVPVDQSIELKTEDLRLIPPAGAGDWLQQQRERAKKRAGATPSSNWLLDAMAQTKSRPQSQAAAGPASEPESGEPGTAGPTTFLAQAETLQRESADVTRETERKRDQQRTREEAGNPLDSFMAGWMTPGDFALLVPPGDSGDAKGAPPVGGIDGGVTLPGTATVRLPQIGPGLARPADPGRGPNPYLADLPDLTPAATGPAATTLNLLPPPPARVLLPALAPVPEPEPPPRTTPAEEFRKSQNDQKYFRQLKRF